MIGVRGTYWGIYAHLASEESASVVCQARINGSSTIKDGVVRVSIRSDPKRVMERAVALLAAGPGAVTAIRARAMQDATNG